MSSHMRCDYCNESFPSSGRLFFHKTIACPSKAANKSLNLSTEIPIRAESTVPPRLTLGLPEQLPRRPKSTVPPKNKQLFRQRTDYSDLIRIEKDGWSCARPNDKAELCGKTFAKLGSVKKHTAKCTFSLGTSPFGCDSCSYRAPICARLVRHLTASAGCPNVRKLLFKSTTNIDSYEKNLVTKSNIEAVLDSEQWRCKVCQKAFAKRRGALTHAFHCETKSTFSCDNCRFTSRLDRLLVKHLLSKKTCQYPSNLIAKKRELSKIESIADSENWLCKICEKIFPSRPSAARHAGNCTGTIVFSCDNCSLTTRFRRAVDKHLRSKTSCHYAKNRLAKKNKKTAKIEPIPNSEEWLCKICEKTLPSRPSATRHSANCKGTVTFGCDNCSYTTRFGHRLVRHLRSMTSCHYAKNRLAKKNKKTAKIEPIPNSEEWLCKICEKTLPSRPSATRHSANCKGTVTFGCDNCSYTTRFGHRLARHLRSMTSCQHAKNSLAKNNKTPTPKIDPIAESDQWRCKICEKRFVSRRSAARHAFSCKGTITFSCDHCSYSTQQGPRIAYHLQSKICEKTRIKRATDSEIWECKMCEKTLSTRDFATRHATRCSGKSEFCCEKCKYTTGIRCHIERHMQSATSCQQFRKKQMEHPSVIPMKRRDQPINDQSTLLTLENGQWKCVKCHKEFSSRSAANIHISYSKCTDTVRFVCNRCDYKTNRPEGFKNHNKEGNIMCLAAQKRLWKREKLAKAIVRVGGPTKAQLQCPCCSFTASSRFALRRHVRSRICLKRNAREPQNNVVRAEKPKSASLTRKNGQWTCIKCQREYSSQSRANQHIAQSKCADTFRFECSRCNYKTNRIGIFKIHSKEGNYLCRASKPAQEVLSCEKCPFKTKEASRLTHHRDNDGCRSWRQRQELMRELGLSSWPEQGTEFRCPRCPFVKKSTSQMLSHLQSRVACALMVRKERISAMNGARQCENCDKLFASTPALLKHLDSKICRVRGLKMLEM